MRALRPLPRRPAWPAGRAFACTLMHPVAGAINPFTAPEPGAMSKRSRIFVAVLLIYMAGTAFLLYRVLADLDPRYRESA